MKNKASFKEYLDSKELLKMALDSVPKVKEIYEIEKYCSVPIKESDDVEYIKLKPKDLIEILWENTPGSPTPKSFTLLSEDEQMSFAWSDAKVRSWVEKMTRKI